MGQFDEKLVGSILPPGVDVERLQGTACSYSLSDSTVSRRRSAHLSASCSHFVTLLQVHILNETRGSTLEVVISRMKLRGTDVRFVLVSATVPNIEDIAAWIGSGTNDDQTAQVFRVRYL